jgi:ketosteroid isomerase-like protein
MSRNKQTVEQYIDGFNRGNHGQILACLTDDVEWLIPGMFHVTGKAAFDREIENEAFIGKPLVTISRLVEQNNVVVAEGTVRAAWKKGGFLNAVYCDVFEMENGKIRRLISYVVALPDADPSEDPLAQYQRSGPRHLPA